MIPTRPLTLIALTAALGAVLPASIGVDAQSASAPPLSRKAQLLRRAARDPALRAAIAEARAAGRDRGPDVVPGVLAVKFSGDTDPARVSLLAAHHGVDAVKQPAFTDFYLFTFDRDQDLAAAARALAAERGVVYAEPVGRARTTYRPNDPLYEFQWNFHQLDLERTWDINQGAGREVVVAVIDSGVAYTTEPGYLQATDLAGTTFLPGYDFIWDDDKPLDFEGHGTHVTGTIAQSTNNNLGVAGIAFNVAVIPVKVVSGLIDEIGGAPNVGDAATVSQGIRFAVEHGAKIINLSLGIRVPSTPLRDAVQFAVDNGALVVASAGNSADEGSPPFYPAAYATEIQGVIAVGATDYARNRAPYSNVNDYVEIAAPGGDTTQDLNGDGYVDGVLQQVPDILHFFETGEFNQFEYAFFEGTSMAAPHVAGMGALLMDQGVTSPKAIEAALKRFATDRGPAGRDSEYGYGLINPRATLRGLGLAR
jgi:serine protease